MATDWNLDASKQVIVYPVYDQSTNPNNVLPLALAAHEFELFLIDLLDDNNLGQAMVNLNTTTNSDIIKVHPKDPDNSTGPDIHWSWTTNAHPDNNLKFDASSK